MVGYIAVSQFRKQQRTITSFLVKATLLEWLSYRMYAESITPIHPYREDPLVPEKLLRMPPANVDNSSNPKRLYACGMFCCSYEIKALRLHPPRGCHNIFGHLPRSHTHWIAGSIRAIQEFLSDGTNIVASTPRLLLLATHPAKAGVELVHSLL